MSSQVQSEQKSKDRHPKSQHNGEQTHSSVQHTDDRSIGGLIRELMQEFTSLVRNEADLAKAEVSQKVGQVQSGIGAMVGAVVFLLVGLIGLMYAGIFGLGLILPLWLSALIVGGIIVLIGVIALVIGRSKLKASSFKPEHSANELQKDREFVRERSR